MLVLLFHNKRITFGKLNHGHCSSHENIYWQVEVMIICTSEEEEDEKSVKEAMDLIPWVLRRDE